MARYKEEELAGMISNLRIVLENFKNAKTANELVSLIMLFGEYVLLITAHYQSTGYYYCGEIITREQFSSNLYLSQIIHLRNLITHGHSIDKIIDTLTILHNTFEEVEPVELIELRNVDELLSYYLQYFRYNKTFCTLLQLYKSIKKSI